MGSAAIRPSPAVGQMLRNRRKELQWTLREVSERLQEQGERLPASTLVRVEQGRLDPGVRRLHLLLRLYRIPPHLVADLVDLEQHAVEEPRELDLTVLHREAVDHLRQGNTAQALAHLFAIRQHDEGDGGSRALRQRATLNVASAARDLGKLRLARQLVDDLLCEPPVPELLSRVLIVASTLWRRQGSTEAALAFARQAASHVDPADHEQRAWIHHQEAALLVATRQADAATKAIDKAIRLYRKLGDADGEARARIVRVGALESGGNVAAAIACARRAVRAAQNDGAELPEISARLELGRLLVESGSAEKGIEELRHALARSVVLGNRQCEFHAHYHLWKAYEITGDDDRKSFEFQAAVHFVKFIDDTSAEAREFRHALTKSKRAQRRGAR